MWENEFSHFSVTILTVSNKLTIHLFCFLFLVLRSYILIKHQKFFFNMIFTIIIIITVKKFHGWNVVTQIFTMKDKFRLGGKKVYAVSDRNFLSIYGKQNISICLK